MVSGKAANWAFSKEGSFSAVVGENTRRVVTLVSATLTIVGSVIASKLTQSLSGSLSLPIVGVWMVAGIIVTYSLSRLQARSQEESSEAIKERVSQLVLELRKQVQARSYGVRRQLIEAPLRELDLDVTPRLGWVRDPRLIEPEAVTEMEADDIVAAFESSKRRMLIVGEPGSGKTMAAYSLIEYLHEAEGDAGRIPLLINLSAWEAQDDFEAFLVDYLCSSVGYEVRERALASTFVSSGRYNLILDGLDEIPAGLRKQFSERLDDFIRALPSEVAVVVTCRIQEYEELRADYLTGLGLVQAVEIVPLTDEQLDHAFIELAKSGKEWELYLLQPHYTAYQRVRDLLSNPLFLNLAVVGDLSPGQLLDWSTTEQELRDLVLDSYLDRTLANQGQYVPEDARRYLRWMARFLNGGELSPFNLKTTDFTVFDLANLTPPKPPGRYRLFFGITVCLIVVGLVWSWTLGLLWGLLGGLMSSSARSSRLTWPPTRHQRRNFLRTLVFLIIALVGSHFSISIGQDETLLRLIATVGLTLGFGAVGIFIGLVILGFAMFGLLGRLAGRHFESPSMLITSRTPREMESRSLIAALFWLVVLTVSGLIFGLALELAWGLVLGLTWELGFGLTLGLAGGLVFGLALGLNDGGWFVLLQKAAHRRLARAGNLPPRPYDFLEWGIERQIFRRVGGGVRFRHNLIQQHLANRSEDVQ